MSRKKSSRKKLEEWNSFGLRALDYNINFEWGFNSTIFDKRFRSDDSPVYESHQYLNLSCVVLWPEEQSGDVYYLRLSEPLKDWFFGPPTDFGVKLGEFPARAKKGNRKYRKFKGEDIPLYDPPYQIGMIEKNRGQFYASASVETEILSRMINLALSGKTIYVHLREILKPKPSGRGKNRWITGVSLHMGEYDERDTQVEPNSPIQQI
jgi:hypothetical protein